MFPLFLLAVAFALLFVVLLFLGWRHVDQRVKLAYADETAEDLKKMLERALEEQQHLTSRVEHLEAIIASEPWDASQTSSIAPLTLPDTETDASSGEPTGRRQRSR